MEEEAKSQAPQKMTQSRAIKEYLEAGYSITSMDAFRLFGATRLSAIIFKLKKHGMNIETVKETSKDKFGNRVSFARYILVDKPDGDVA